MLWKDQIREWKDEAREDGLLAGERNAKIEATKNLLKMNVLTVEQIASAEQLSVEEIIKIKDSLKI